MYEPGHVFDTLEGLNTQCLMDHMVLNVEDDEKMVAFYAKVIMFPIERPDEYRSGKVPFPSVRLNADSTTLQKSQVELIPFGKGGVSMSLEPL